MIFLFPSPSSRLQNPTREFWFPVCTRPALGPVGPFAGCCHSVLLLLLLLLDTHCPNKQIILHRDSVTQLSGLHHMLPLKAAIWHQLVPFDMQVCACSVQHSDSTACSACFTFFHSHPFQLNEAEREVLHRICMYLHRSWTSGIVGMQLLH